MESNTPLRYPGMTVREFPLSAISARKIVNDLAMNHTGRIRISRHAKQRMPERCITLRQILHVFASKHSRCIEVPHQTAAGDAIEIVTALKRHEDDPPVFVVTVMIK
ncbi:DUF4258 domain-containing protein [Yersinia frederiksenii]|uniref:DUF4258 domain-containing protein n=1 Tax=Yersinia frederiksenii TaxID=29484 RepID=UPI0011A1C1F4|nr:DUF4258 domain-containing protein [Yersinia frederiksenii]